MKMEKQKIIVILTGLVGCFLTSLTSTTAVMIVKGWDIQGGFPELINRLSVGYSSATMVVVFIFPFLIPKMTSLLEEKLDKNI